MRVTTRCDAKGTIKVAINMSSNVGDGPQPPLHAKHESKPVADPLTIDDLPETDESDYDYEPSLDDDEKEDDESDDDEYDSDGNEDKCDSGDEFDTIDSDAGDADGDDGDEEEKGGHHSKKKRPIGKAGGGRG